MSDNANATTEAPSMTIPFERIIEVLRAKNADLEWQNTILQAQVTEMQTQAAEAAPLSDHSTIETEAPNPPETE